MKQITKLFFVALLGVFSAATAWGQVDFNLNELYQNGTKVTEKTVITTSGGTLTFTDEDENFTILLTRNSGNQPGFYTSSGYFRFYSSDTVELTAADGITITKVVVTPNGTSFSLSAMEGLNTSTKTWTGSASDITFTGSGTNKWDKLTITYTTGGSSSAVATTTTISASGITNTDVYSSTEAGSLSAVVKDNNNAVINGASIAWSGNNDDVATIDASTGVVTLVSAGTVTFTATYDGVANQYIGSSDSYQMTVTSSAPYVQPTEIEITPNYTFWGQTTQFSGSTYNNLSGSKDNVSLNWSRGNGSTYANTTGMRFYKDNTLTFTAPSKYEIKSIVLTVSNTYDDLAFSPSGFNSTTTTWTGSSETVTMSRPSNATSYSTITKFIITIGAPSTDPTISANNVNIAYSATNGSIAYTLTNPVSGGVLTAETTATWLTPGSDNGTAILFTCEANTANTSRSATVTLTYTYNTNETVTTDVTVTQEAAPVIYTTIPSLFEAATSTATNVNITFGSWVVSGVKNSNAYLTDNQGHGLIIYESEHGFAVNDVLSGTVSCELQLYRGSAELTGIKASTDGLTVTKNGSVTAQTIAINSLGGVNTGALLSFEGLTYNGSALVDGDSQTITPYTTLYDYGSTFENGKSYDVTGIYLQYNSTKELLPRSADDIEETSIPSIVLTPSTNNHTAAAVNDGSIAITYSNITISSASDFTIKYYDSNETELSEEPDWIAAAVESVSGDYVITYLLDANTGAARTAYLKVLAGGVYSNLITINQAEPVVDYAFLPFTFNAGKNALVQGLSAFGLGTDYASSTAPTTQLKFDSTGDWLMLKINEAIPGTFTFAYDIKGNGFSQSSTSTFTVQISADGESFTDFKVYTVLGDTQTEQFDNMPETVRFIKWIYTEKGATSGGNVGLGNIKITRPDQPTNMTVTASLDGGRYWATFYNSAACYTLPAGAKAYTMNGDHNLYLLGEGNVIPANTAVIIIAEATSDAATLELTLTKTDDETVAISGTTNILKGSNYPVPVTGTPYVLGNKSGIQFYKYTGDNIPANKAYYK